MLPFKCRKLRRRSDQDSQTGRNIVPQSIGGIHDVAVEGNRAYYSYSFNIENKNMAKLADKLLSKDIATVAAIPSSNKLRVSRAMADYERQIKRTRKFGEFLDEFYSEQPKLRALLNKTTRDTRTIWLTLARAYATFVFQRRQTSMNNEQNRPDTALDSPSSESVRKSVEESITHMHSGFMDFHIDGAIRARMDQSSISPRYFEKDPYIRLTLTRIFYKDASIDNRNAVGASLLIHKSGVCILTFEVELEGVMDAGSAAVRMRSDQYEPDEFLISINLLSEWSRSQATTKDKVKIRVLELLKLYPRKSKLAELDHFEGTRWVPVRRFDKHGNDIADEAGEPFSLNVAFEAYVDTIKYLAGTKNYGEWQCYTTVSISAPRCGCKPEEFKSNHGQELASLLLLASTRTKLTQSTVDTVLSNRLLSGSRELWLTGARAIIVDFSEQQSDSLDDMRILIPIESAILQARQLERVDLETSDPFIDNKQTLAAQTSLSTGLQEYKRNLYTGPDDKNVVDALLSEMGASDLYQQLLDRVQLLGAIFSSESAKEQTRRSLLISLAGFLVVLVFLLPRIDEALLTFGELGTWPHEALQRADAFTGGRPSLILWVYFTLLALSVLVILSTWLRIRPRRLALGSVGRSTRGQYDVVLSMESDIFTRVTRQQEPK